MKNTTIICLIICFLNNKWINDQITTEIKQYMETNDNNNATLQNLWDAAEASLREKYIAIQAYLKKEEQSHISSLNSQLMQLEKEQQVKPKISRRGDIIKIRVEINKTEKNKTIERTNEAQELVL